MKYHIFSPNLKKVKKWLISGHNIEILKCLLPLLNILKAVSPNIETYVIELVKARRVKADLQQYCTEINNFIQGIKREESIANLQLHIDLRIIVNSEVFHHVDHVKECLRDFPNYEIVKSPELSAFSGCAFTASKRTIFTEKFFLDTRIDIICFSFHR